ncbi:MAG TPA: NADH-ubiquinone oxidoreductase-F iron-sulfur binding region domain-containing protein [Acidimicrobiales bacterium]|nr:NADH-ubiquinone oxidoreductase-F iron-sulfur binding region domain-containing protein [Acidimicrobiales bacterium]
MPTATDTRVEPLLASWRAAQRRDLATHLAHHGPLSLGDPTWLTRMTKAVDEAGLTGRGGAGFPSAVKHRAARGAAVAPVVVVNAMEGEPASQKDAVLLTCVPHLVLDGAQVAAALVGASAIVACVAADQDVLADALAGAVAERAGTGWSPVPVQLARPPGRYVAGEESALVDWLELGRGAPRFRPDKAVPLRIGRQPAMVHNAETLAHLALIARRGPGAFRGAGTEHAPGTTLVTISGGVEHPGVYEVSAGTPLQEIIALARPGITPAAVLVGGYGGTWIAARHLDVPFAAGPLRALGAGPGAGVLVVLPAGACGLADTARIASYMAGQSAGQCGPCVFGLPAIASDLAALADGRADMALPERLRRRLGLVAGRGACRHPDGVARMVASALEVFADDVALHLAGRTCPGRAHPSVVLW